MSITADGSFVLRDGTKTLYSAVVECFPRLDNAGDTVVDARVVGNGSEDDGQQIGGIALTFTTAQLTALTASGADEVAKYYNLCEQAVAGYLGGLSDNTGITFTIS